MNTYLADTCQAAFVKLDNQSRMTDGAIGPLVDKSMLCWFV